MAILDMPNYIWITLLIMVVLTLFCTLVLNKWFITAIIMFIVLGALAFILPNFKPIRYEPLLGYAAFVAILSLILSLILWFMTRDWRKKRQLKKYEKERARFEQQHRP
ncbi:hypothetical protein [Staphylococcus delphini]|uniref:hypothetical protein n=1 Tax=Staphylococcus delphini TaxID=53344 RepID=UPI0012D310AF|nr:hypothetical protein [Staphylococcus delphini]MBZ8175913.1 hypothetical protein [Staphylococcus delphini]MTV20467.1 hypothetical protein [Staphylococcus delphini]UXS20639.1 hypothetical protein MUA22_07300 [Staphylococcus delphini]UXS56644.1 hypothetical protein MUA44_07295 [Staphylococcus delphini]